MPLTPGTRLGGYEVVSPLGAGGMGEVYRARDSKLNRDVAIKVLLPAVANDPDRLARFSREAQVLASLNHPNIAQIYGVEDGPAEAGRHMRALVMELVEGPTLADRIAQGAIPLDEALPIARQIADALEAAHEQGIIHRDLKPANIKVRADGTVKVLDFGLAKAMDPTPSSMANATMSPTLSLHATQAGLILGTAAYMSPEQAKGKAADRRADIWAFGVVLVEMLTGRLLFSGESAAETMAAVMMQLPDLSALPSATPAPIRELVRRCLVKDPRSRLQSIGDARIVIDAVINDAQHAPIATVVPSLSRRTWMAGAAVMVLSAAITGAAIWTRQAPVTERSIKRFTIQLPSSVQFRDLGQGAMALSPDGQRLVYSATDNQSFFVRDFHTGETRVLEGTQGRRPIQPVFSPDGRDVAFVSQVPFPSIQKIPVTGGMPIVLYRLQEGGFGAILGFTWSEDGLLASHGRSIVAIPATGGSPLVVLTLAADEQAYNPGRLPGGDTILYTRAKGGAEDRWHTAEIVLQRPGSTAEVLLAGGSDARYVSTGHIVFAVGGVLYARTFDARRQKFTSDAVPVLAGVRRNTTGAATHFAFGDDASMVYLPGPVGRGAQNDVVFAGSVGRLNRLGLPLGRYRDVRISPDGRWAALTATESAERHIWIQDLMGERAFRRLTFEGKQNAFPLWSPDSMRLTFQSDRGGDQALYSQRIDGSGGAARLTTPAAGESHTPQSWNADGKILLVDVTKGAPAARGHELWIRSGDSPELRPVASVKSGVLLNAAFSPDGRWVSYTSTELGRAQLFVQPFPATGAKYQVSRNPDDGHHGVWSADGQRLYFVPSPSRFGYVPVSTKNDSFEFGPFVELFAGFTEGNAPADHRTYDVLRDGRLAGVIDAVTPLDEGSNAVVSPQINVVLNWFEELKTMVPVP